MYLKYMCKGNSREKQTLHYIKQYEHNWADKTKK